MPDVWTLQQKFNKTVAEDKQSTSKDMPDFWTLQQKFNKTVAEDKQSTSKDKLGLVF